MVQLATLVAQSRVVYSNHRCSRGNSESQSVIEFGRALSTAGLSHVSAANIIPYLVKGSKKVDYNGTENTLRLKYHAVSSETVKSECPSISTHLHKKVTREDGNTTSS